MDTVLEIKNYTNLCLAVIGLFLNLYFLGCIAFIKALRQWRYLLIGWQAFCDIIGQCILSITVHAIWLIDRHPRARGWVEDLIGVKAWVELNDFKSCQMYEIIRLINEYSVGPVLTFLAVERFIIVVYPFKAKQWLTQNVYIAASIFIPCFTVGMTLGYLQEGRYGCWEKGIKGIYRNQLVKFITDIFLIFVIPATACCVMYGFVASELMKSTKTKTTEGSEMAEKEKRNILLTKCFFGTTIAWIVCWSFTYYWESQRDTLKWRDEYKWTAGEYVIYQFKDFGMYVYTVINPIIFITANRQFQMPMKSMWNKIFAAASRK